MGLGDSDILFQIGVEPCGHVFYLFLYIFSDVLNNAKIPLVLHLHELKI